MKKIKHNSYLFENILKVFSANFIVVIVGFVSTLVFPKILSIDDYALYHTYTLYLSYITILHLGFPSGLVIKYAGKNYHEIDGRQYKAEMEITSILLFSFTFAFLTIAIIVNSKMLFWIALSIIPYDIIGSYKGLLQSWGLFKKYSIISVFLTLLVPFLAIAFYLINKTLPGNVYIMFFLLIHWIVCIYIYAEIWKKTKGLKSGKYFTKENWKIEKNGLALLIGNYINTLFVSSDKQFVKMFFDNSCFAFYSFGMSMQAIMTVLITSISQPLFPSIAQGKFKNEDYNNIKELLIVLGSLSGLAYFATVIIVNNFITKYVDSLNVIGIYFVVFPAMAVINCLYINLYKVMNMMKKYIITLAGILALGVILNYLAVKFYPDYTGVAIATTLTYYVWFFVGIKQFDFLKITSKDIGYLILFIVAFFSITKYLPAYLGIPLYTLCIVVLVLIFYRDKAHWIITRLKRSIK